MKAINGFLIYFCWQKNLEAALRQCEEGKTYAMQHI